MTVEINDEPRRVNQHDVAHQYDDHAIWRRYYEWIAKSDQRIEADVPDEPYYDMQGAVS